MRFVEAVERGQLDDRLDLAFEQDRDDEDVGRRRRAESGTDLDVVGRHVGEEDRFLFDGGLADQAFAGAEARLQLLAFGVGVTGEQPQIRFLGGRFVEVDDAVLHRHERRQLRQDRARHGGEVALALQQARELREVGLQPVLRGVLFGRVAQVDDHFVDVVLEGRDFAGRFDVDRLRQVALGHGGRDFGDGAHLGRQVRGETVDVVGEVLPRAGDAAHVGLAAELTFGADFLRDARHFRRERR